MKESIGIILHVEDWDTYSVWSFIPSLSLKELIVLIQIL